MAKFLGNSGYRMGKKQRPEFKKVLFLFIVALLVVIFGIIGYSQLEGWSFIDALYMTLITITTVGFGEVHPLTTAGKLFTIFLILGGILTISIWLSALTSVVIHREIRPLFWRKKMQKAIQSLENHVIICGAGETARTVIDEFIQSKEKFVIIEKEASVLSDLLEVYSDILVVEGDATKDETLMETNLKKARGLITALPTDAENLFVVISAKALNPKIRVVSRAVDAQTQKKLKQVGADYVISHKILEGIRMASVMLRPTVVSFLDVIMRDTEVTLRLENLEVPPNSPLKNKTLQESRIPQVTGLIIIAMKKEDGRFIFNPGSKNILQEGDEIIILGLTEQFEKLQTYLKYGALKSEAAN